MNLALLSHFMPTLSAARCTSFAEVMPENLNNELSFFI